MVTNSDPQPSSTTTMAVVLFGRKIGVSLAQPEEDESMAARTLCSLKHAPLDEEEMVELPRMKQQVLNRCGGRAIGGSVCCRGGITKPPSPPPSSSSKSRRRLRFSGFSGDEEVLRVPKVPKVAKLQPSQAMLDQVRPFIILPTHMPEIPGLTGEMIGRRGRPFWKQLTVTDLKDDQSKLSLSKEDVEECISPMLSRTEDPISGVKVTIYDLSGGSFEMAYKKWAGGKTHVLTSGWKEFYKRHGLQEHKDYLTVWNFRRADTGKLCFLLTWRRLEFCVFPIKRKLLKGL